MKPVMGYKKIFSNLRTRICRNSEARVSSVSVGAGFGWRQRISNEAIRKRVFGCAAGTSIRENIQHHRLRWLGHVLRMPKHRLPRRVLFSVPLRRQ
ncbi:hypothetical protein T265_02967 [Opisthorchis viverrini]|uniref:Uncharacterized protein n=1 Tax=Opisthorchis viverrini TaxID=6198 RepID=A0A074ZXF8_OPIVI|nr:hypothetical protein T265_02967 [Opisthorchis viverrini]KER30612.1 hypothetical protein T265_02967 [Opisthorchis viverrini]